MSRIASRGRVHGGFLGRNGLTLAFLALMLLSLVGHAWTGLRVHNEDLAHHGDEAVSMWAYLHEPHFLSTLFENWESEFLQMGLFVLGTAYLRQKGASESRPLDPSDEANKRPPVPLEQRPWPVRRGGLWAKAYAHSLSAALLALFAMSFVGHWFASWRLAAQEKASHGVAGDSLWEYLSASDLWFESFQNWQSEFLAVIALVVLSIFLREKDSTESKDVDAPHSQTGN